MTTTNWILAARRFALSLPFAFLTASGAAAQTPPPPDITTLSMQDLLNVDVVSTASKFPQEVRETPASVTVITKEDIHRYGHRTLSDALGSVRGFYTTYDRNYSYLGLRGVSRPGDYNTRFLLLLDGNRMNDGIYDMAPIGTDFPIDVSLIERIEVIRGPGSSLYGTSAFFAVVNVVTSTGASRNGFQVESRAGSLSTRGALASFGGVAGHGTEFSSAARCMARPARRVSISRNSTAASPAAAWRATLTATSRSMFSARCRWGESRFAAAWDAAKSRSRPRPLTRSLVTAAKPRPTAAPHSARCTTVRSAGTG